MICVISGRRQNCSVAVLMYQTQFIWDDSYDKRMKSHYRSTKSACNTLWSRNNVENQGQGQGQASSSKDFVGLECTDKINIEVVIDDQQNDTN